MLQQYNKFSTNDLQNKTAHARHFKPNKFQP